MDDARLLRRYVEEHADDAFAELVRRHLSLVYFAALRQTHGDVALAQDVTQAVFTDLVRKAPMLTDRAVLTGWLYTSVRFAAAKARRSEGRRRAREQEAYVMQELIRTDDTAANWERLRPVIDDALHALDATDREAILLRFFEGRAFAEVGAALQLTEDAARKRVERALDKLRAMLARQGVRSTTAALAVELAVPALSATPPALASAVTAAALAGAAGGAVWLPRIFAFMSTTKVWSGIAVVLAAVAVFEYREAATARSEGAQRENEWRGKFAAAVIQAKRQEERAAAAESDNLKLLKAIEAAKASGVVKALEDAQPVTVQAIEERIRQAWKLAADGKFDEALREFLWCVDEGIPRVPEMRLSRYQTMAPMLMRLGEQFHPPAIAALRDRRDAMERDLQRTGDAPELSSRAAAEFASINKALREEERTLAMYEILPPGDPRRQVLGYAVFDRLVEARRYDDAAQVRRLSTMLSQIDQQRSGERQGAQKGFTYSREKFYPTMGNNLEVLAGSGQLTDARTLAERLIAFDDTPKTRVLIQHHLERAGQPGLMAASPKP